MTLNFNRKQPPFYTGGLSNVMQPGANLGNVYYVQQFTGDDANSGLRPDIPFATITAALAECVNERNDTIVVIDYWNSDTGNFPIDVNKSGVTIVGAKGGSYSSWVAMTPVGANAIFNINAQNVRLIDLYLVGEATQACIVFTGSNQRIGIYGCYFSGGTYGLEMQTNIPGAECEIANCYFQQTLSVGGILALNQAFLRIRDCIFDRVQGIAIHINQAAGGVQILDNRIACDSDVAGRAITFFNGVYRAIVDGNSAGFGEAQGVLANPYLDNSGVDVNFWGRNYWCEALTAPG